MSDRISDPLTFPCGASTKNRLCKAAMTEGVADALNRATARHVTLYRRWAEGGAGLLLPGKFIDVAVDSPSIRLHAKDMEITDLDLTAAGEVGPSRRSCARQRSTHWA